MASWGRVRQSKLKHLAFQWKRYYSQNPFAAQARKTYLSQNPSRVFQNSDTASSFCRSMKLFGAPAQGSSSSLPLISANGYVGNRHFSVFNEFSEKMKVEANRTKQTTEQLYKHVDSAWTEAEATAKKVSTNMKEKISAAKEEVKETKHGTDSKDGSKASSGEENFQQSASSENAETLFSKLKPSLPFQKVSLAFQKLKGAKVADLAKKGYGIVKDELSDTTSKKKHLQYTPSTSTGERSTKTDIVIVQSEQSPWSKKWEAFKEKIRSQPTFKRVSGYSEPVVTKSQEKQMLQYQSRKYVNEIRMFILPLVSFSLPEFVTEVQEVVKPVLRAYMKGDAETLKKYCFPEVIERCKAEHGAYQSNGIFFDNKEIYLVVLLLIYGFSWRILHISDVEVRETKMMGNSPIIILAFQTQQVYCVCDRHDSITEGSQDIIHTVYYAWAMQLVDAEELGDGALYPIWRLREMQQFGVQALI
ncbi:hypothetical protein ACB092_10G148400 [Castanea dentata]